MADLPGDLALPFACREFTLQDDSGATQRFAGPSDPEAVLNALGDEEYERDEQLPYWAECWPAAEVLYRYLSRYQWQTAQTILEIGCGLGCISAMLAHKGHRVVAIDISVSACRYARHNGASANHAPSVVCADWRCLPIHVCCDVIVASDILYEERWIEPVLACIGRYLSPRGKALIADPGRRHWNSFLLRAQDAALSTSIVHSESVNSEKTTVSIASFQRK